MKVLMLATYFPKPGNAWMGNWALLQAQALRRAGVALEVASFTSWVPRWAARSRGAKTYAECPASHDWAGVRTEYPRWLYYPVGPARVWNERHPLRMLGLAWRQAGAWLRRKVEAFQPDLVYAHHTGVNGYLALRLQEEFGLPFLVTDHDFGEIQCCRQYPERRRLFGQVAERAYRMIAVAKRMEQEVRSQFPQARTETIPNGTEPIPEEIRRRPRPGERAGTVTFFSCGAFYERKGFPLLVEAFCRAARQRPELRLRIAGDGADRARVEERLRECGAREQVTLLGALTHEQVLQEMAWADAFVLTGWDEPFATVYLEAMSAGLPIVCCEDGGITDVLRHEVHGLTVPPRDGAAITAAMERLAGSEGLRRRLGEAGPALFEGELQWRHHAERMKALFEAAAGTREMARV